jgi:hypothetical protein
VNYIYKTRARKAGRESSEEGVDVTCLGGACTLGNVHDDISDNKKTCVRLHGQGGRFGEESQGRVTGREGECERYARRRRTNAAMTKHLWERNKTGDAWWGGEGTEVYHVT